MYACTFHNKQQATINLPLSIKLINGNKNNKYQASKTHSFLQLFSLKAFKKLRKNKDQSL